MSRLLSIFALFALGFALSYPIMVQSDYFGLHSAPRISELAREYGFSAESPAEEAAPILDRSEIYFEQSESIDPNRRIEVLSEALASGSAEDLYLVRSDYVSSFPDYEQHLLPVLRRESLKNLLKRFSQADWDNWPNAAFGKDAGPTLARLYVDDVTAVNAELGSYLETAAYLFYRQNKSVLEGEEFVLAQEILLAHDRAELILKHRKSTSIPARYLFYPQIASDPQFLEQLEELKCNAVSKRLAQQEQIGVQEMDLLGQIRIPHCGQGIVPGVRSFLHRLTLEATPEDRDLFLRHKPARKAVKVLSWRSQEINSALARFFAVVSVDFLQIEEFELAEVYLNKSIKAEPGLKIQDLVSSYLYIEEEVEEGYIPEEQPALIDPFEPVDEEEVIAEGYEEAPVEGVYNEDSGEDVPADASTEKSASGFMLLLLLLGIGVVLFIWTRLSSGGRSYDGYEAGESMSEDDQFWDSDFELEEDQDDMLREEEVNQNY